MLVTYALFLILEDATKLIWGAESYYASEPYALLGNVSFFGLSYVGYDFALIGAGGGHRPSALVRAQPHRHRQDRAWRSSMTATSAAPWASTSPACSRSPSLLVSFSPRSAAPSPRRRFRCSPASASPSSCSASPSSSSAVSGSVEGAAIAALFVGFARAAAIHLVPWAELFIVYLVMALVLAFRPEGLFQRTAARKI